MTVADPSSMLPLVPAAATAGPPACIKTGTRLVYFGMTANIPGEDKQLVQDDNGRWVDRQTGQRYAEEDIAGAAAGGFTVLQVGYVDRDVAVIGTKFYTLDARTKKCTFALGSGMVTHAGCAADYWIHPEVLRTLQEVNEGGIHILRMPYTLGSKQYSAIRIQSEDISGYQAHVYDLETGLLIFHASRAQGKTVNTAPLGGAGQAGTGQGSTQVVVGWIAGIKDVNVPWQNMAVPPWVGEFKQLEYGGAQTSDVPAARSRFSRRMTVSVAPVARGPNWVRTSSTFTIESIAGMPPEQARQEGACGVASVGGLWIAPAGLAQLRRGQVVETDQFVGTTTTVSRADDRSVTLTEAGPLHRIDCTYDTSSGILVMMHVEQQFGLATITHDMRLTDRR
ncbi:MAG: hypothetical protein ABSH08_06010 [Tepidisphaeraceae bacterium]